MVATVQINALPILVPVQIQEHEHAPSHHRRLPLNYRPRIYRIPRPGSWVSNGVYGADGRLSFDRVTGRHIDIIV